MLGALIGAVAFVALAASADAYPYLYWGNCGDGCVGGATVGRANLDGTGVEQSFITGASSPTSVAVNDSYIFWGNYGSDTIGRASLDGSGAVENLVTLPGFAGGVAADSNYVYWDNAGGAGSIGRANLDGTGVNQSFITGTTDPAAIAIAGGYIYWVNYGSNTIGRANVDGTGVDQSFITGTDLPEGLAVDANHIYWANTEDTTIGRANLDGTGVDQSFITGASAPAGLAVDGSHIYWGNLDEDTIGRANLDGTGVDQSFITGVQGPFGLAVGTSPTTTTASGGTATFATGAQAVTLSATITALSGTVNEGTVRFTVRNGATTVGSATTSATVSNGLASVDYVLPPGTPAGLYTTDAQYNPGPDFEASSDSGHLLTVQPAATTTVGSDASARFSTSAQHVTLSANVSSPAGTVNEGTVTFTVRNGTTTVGSATTSATVSNGLASVDYVLPPGTSAGAYTIDAQYDAGTDFEAGSAAGKTLTVVAAPAASIASPSSPETYAVGENVATSFFCAEGTGGTGLSSCDDSTGTNTTDGGHGRLDTATPGSHTYAVTATSNDGLTGTASISYTVLSATTTPTTTSTTTTTTPPRRRSEPTRISGISISPRSLTWCARCRYPSSRLHLRLNRRATVRLVLRARVRDRWRQVAVSTLHGHRGANRFRIAGRWHGEMVPARRVQILVKLHANGRWTTHKTLRLVVRSPYTTRILNQTRAAMSTRVRAQLASR